MLRVVAYSIKYLIIGLYLLVNMMYVHIVFKLQAICTFAFSKPNVEIAMQLSTGTITLNLQCFAN